MPWILNHHRIRNNETLTTMFGGLANANRTPTRSWRTAKYNIISAFCFAYNHKTIQNLSYLSQILNNSLISRLKVTGLRFADPFDLTKFNNYLFSCSCRIMVPTVCANYWPACLIRMSWPSQNFLYRAFKLTLYPGSTASLSNFLNIVCRWTVKSCPLCRGSIL